MKKISAVLSVLVCAVSFVWGLQKDQIESKMTTDLAAAVKILDKNESIELKSKELFAIFDEYFDYKLMAKLSLSRLYKTLSKEEQNKFCSLFEARIKKSFSEKLSLYGGQTIELVGGEFPTPNRYFQKAVIKDGDQKNVASKEGYKLLFKFYRDEENGEFYIYDIDVIGVSLIQTYRTQFEDLKERAGFDEILKHLEISDLPDL